MWAFIDLFYHKILYFSLYIELTFYIAIANKNK